MSHRIKLEFQINIFFYACAQSIIRSYNLLSSEWCNWWWNLQGTSLGGHIFNFIGKKVVNPSLRQPNICPPFYHDYSTNPISSPLSPFIKYYSNILALSVNVLSYVNKAITDYLCDRHLRMSEWQKLLQLIDEPEMLHIPCLKKRLSTAFFMTIDEWHVAASTLLQLTCLVVVRYVTGRQCQVLSQVRWVG